MLLKQWRTSSSRLEKLPSIPLGLGIYLFKDWHNSESPLRWDENIFHSQIQVHALLEQRIFLDWSHPFFFLLLPRFLLFVTAPQGAGTFSAASGNICSIPLGVFLHPVTVFYIPLHAWCMKTLQFWLQKDNILKWRLVCWIPGKGELLRALGLSWSQPSPSPQALQQWQNALWWLSSDSWGQSVGFDGHVALQNCENSSTFVSLPVFSVNVVFLPCCFCSPWASAVVLEGHTHMFSLIHVFVL